VRRGFGILFTFVLVCGAVALGGGVVLLVAGPRGEGVLAVIAASLIFLGCSMLRRTQRWLDELSANRSWPDELAPV